MHLPIEGQSVRVVPLNESLRRPVTGDSRSLTEQPVEAVERGRETSVESDNVELSKQATRYQEHLQSIREESGRSSSVADVNAAYSLAIATRSQVQQDTTSATVAHGGGVRQQQVLGLLA